MNSKQASCWLWLFLLHWAAIPHPTAAQESARLDPDNLLQYRTATGERAAVKTVADWQRRRDEVVRGMQIVMGPAPDLARDVPPEFQLVEEIDCGNYVRRFITYRADEGAPTPAYLCVPKELLAGGHKAPAVLCLHPTDAKLGHQVVVGLGGRPHRQYAAELAERGYVTLSPAYPHLANYWPHLEELGYASGTRKAIWDNQRALDLLATFPEVDTAPGFGAIGHSLGGHNAIFTAVCDERIRVVVSSCGFDSFRDYYDGRQANWYFGHGWCQMRYMPRLSDYRDRLREIPFDFPELLGALAPRSLWISAPLNDDNFRWRSVDRCVTAAREVYRLFDQDEQLTVVHPACDHDFPDEVRRQAYRALDAVLRKPASPKN